METLALWETCAVLDCVFQVSGAGARPVCKCDSCSIGPTTECTSDNICVSTSCNSLTGACDLTNNTLPCDDFNACTVDDTVTVPRAH